MKYNRKQRMLITGISGLLGNNLALVLKGRYDILGLYNEHKVVIDGVSTRQCDLSFEDEVNKVVNDFVPQVVIHCAALSNIDVCEKNHELSFRSNVVGTEVLVKSLCDIKCKIIYVSTDNIYGDNDGKPLDENCALEATNYYGETKILAEKICLKDENALVLRTNIFGWNIQNKYSLSEWVLHGLQSENEFTGFTDAIFSSIYTFDFAEILNKAIIKDLKGIYNLGSRTHISKCEFAQKIANYLDYDEKLIQPLLMDDFPMKAKRKKGLAMDVSKMESALGCAFPTIEESIEHFCNDYKNGIEKKIKSCIYPKLDVIPYGRQMIDENDIQVVVEVLKSGNLTQGTKVREFENELKKFIGAKYCVSMNSGTSALHSACLAVGVSEGDEVITSANSFVASANCVLYCGGTPVFADIDQATYNLTALTIEKRITDKTKAVIVVHFAGQSCEMEDIWDLVKKKEQEFGNKIFIIEDASHALGSKYKDVYVGACQYSDLATLSFHPVKHITTAEGGAVLTNDEKLYHKVRAFSSHGIISDKARFIGEKEMHSDADGQKRPWYYEQQMLGFNYRISDVQCALGISQLTKLPFFMTRRREIVEYYNKQFKQIEGVKTPHESQNCFSNFHLYVLLFDFNNLGITRSELIKKLIEKGIRTQVHYIPIYYHPYYVEKFGRQKDDFPNIERYYSQCLSIPLFPAMLMEEVRIVVEQVKDIISCKVI